MNTLDENMENKMKESILAAHKERKMNKKKHKEKGSKETFDSADLQKESRTKVEETKKTKQSNVKDYEQPKGTSTEKRDKEMSKTQDATNKNSGNAK